MPFLRAARIKRGLTPQAEQEEILKPPVAVPAEIEEAEKEPEFEPAKIKELHRLIDEKVDEKNEKTEELVTEDNGDSVNVPDVPEEQEQDLTPEPEAEIQEIEEIQESAAEVQEIQETREIEQPEELKELEEPEIPEVIEVVEVLEIPEIPDIPEIELADITEDLTSETAIEIPAVEITEDETEQEQAVETEKESESGTEEAAEEAKSEVFDENSLLDDADDNHEDIISIIEPEPEIETEQEQEQEAEQEQEQEQPVTEPEEPKEPEEFKLKYDFTSGERYVDKVSTKTEFDKVLDELSAISKDLLSWQVEKFARDYTNKFHDENDKSDSDAKKYEAFLGGYITNAAMILYDNGYRDAAIKQLDQAKSILEARKKLENETLAIKTRVEEEDATVDLSDILGLFGDA